MILLKQLEKLNITTFAVKTFFIGLFFLSLFALGMVCYYSYGKFTILLLEQYGKTNKLEVFRSTYLTQNRFLMIRLLLALWLILLSWGLMKLNKFTLFFSAKISSLFQSLRKFKEYLLEYYFTLSLSEKSIFFCMIGFIAAVKWLFLIHSYFHIDEIFSYIFFVKKGFLVSISYYPGPNNHILYSLIAYVLQPLFPDPFYLMKVPSFLISLLSSCFLFFLMLRYFSFRWSVMGTLLFSLSWNFFFYSLFGRGYVLMTSLTLIAAFMVLEIISGRNEKFKWHLYVLSSILAFYSMLGYIYPFISFGLLIGGFILYEKKYDQLFSFFYYHTIIVLTVLLLYTPVLLVSGLDSLISNPWVASLTWKDFLVALPGMIDSAFVYIANIEYGAVWIGTTVIFLAALILLRTNRKPFFFLIVSFFVTPLLVLMIQHARPFDRVWTYLIFPFSVCVVILIEFIFSLVPDFEKVKRFLSVLICLGIVGSNTFLFYDSTRYGFQIYDQIGRISHYVVEEGNGNVYTNEDVYNIYLRYESQQMRKDLVPEMAALPEAREYGYVLLIPGSSFPPAIHREDYLLKEKNEYIEVYQFKW